MGLLVMMRTPAEGLTVEQQAILTSLGLAADASIVEIRAALQKLKTQRRYTNEAIRAFEKLENLKYA